MFRKERGWIKISTSLEVEADAQCETQVSVTDPHTVNVSGWCGRQDACLCLNALRVIFILYIGSNKQLRAGQMGHSGRDTVSFFFLKQVGLKYSPESWFIQAASLLMESFPLQIGAHTAIFTLELTFWGGKGGAPIFSWFSKRPISFTTSGIMKVQPIILQVVEYKNNIQIWILIKTFFNCR